MPKKLDRCVERPCRFTKGDAVDAVVSRGAQEETFLKGTVRWIALRDNGKFEYYSVFVDFPNESRSMVYTESQLRVSR